MPYRLITIPASHYCEKARWALQRRGIVFEESGHLPILHYAASYPASRTRTVPILVGDGPTLTDSTDILKFTDAFAPPGDELFPAEPELHAEVSALEDHFDQKLGPAARRWVYFHLLPNATLAMQALGAGVGSTERGVGAVLFPLTRLAIRRGLGVYPQKSAKSLARVQQIFADVGQTLADGRNYLVGNRFTAADLTFAALSALVLCPPNYGAKLPSLSDVPPEMAHEICRLRDLPAGRFAMRLYAEDRQQIRKK